ncbi:MAG: hypothetical protein IJ044_02420 [Oscillospiraceae bacterium]|nr:hypothetical protein [Oscillospiraceae bacterium]
MSLFKKRISTKDMGAIFFEVSRVRSKNMIDICKRININEKPFPFIISCFAINYGYMKRTIEKKYPVLVVNQIMNNAYQCFFNAFKEYFKAIDLSCLEIEVERFTSFLEDTIREGNNGAYDNPIYKLTKKFIKDIRDSADDYFDAIGMMEIQIELSSWLSQSEFLITDFTVK